MWDLKIKKNVKFTIFQVVSLSIIFLLLYKYLFNFFGVEYIGLWSLIMSFSSLTQISALGMNGGITKFVASYLARNDKVGSTLLIETACISIFVISSIFITIVYYPIIAIIEIIISDSKLLQDAIDLIPLSLASFLLSGVAGVMISALDGSQRIDIRSIIMTINGLLFFLLVLVLVPIYGFIGLGYAQVIQGVIFLLISWITLKKQFNLLPLIPVNWNMGMFKEILGYGINFQLSSIMIMLSEPIVKMLLTYFGSLSMTGYFEMSNRMVVQVRSLIVSANQVMVPVVSTLCESGKDKIIELNHRTYKFLLLVSLPIFSAIIAFLPIISEMWLGQYEISFVLMTIALTIGWTINTLSSPIYHSNLGTGQLKPNVISHAVVCTTNLILGALLGYLLGGNAVIFVYVISLILGVVVLFSYYYKENNIEFDNDFFKISTKYSFLVILSAFVSLLTYYYFQNITGYIVTGIVSVFTYLILVSFVTYHYKKIFL